MTGWQLRKNKRTWITLRTLFYINAFVLFVFLFYDSAV